MPSATEKLSENIAKLNVELDFFHVTLSKLDEIINGTSKTGGLKERMAVAEDDIRRNKESFEKISGNITTLRNEMILEIGNISRERTDFRRDLWQGMVKVALNVVVAGVIGVLFWKLVLLLAVNSPIP